VNVLYLVKERLLDAPVLYMSRPIVRSKAEYYRLLQTVRDEDAWEAWVEYILAAVGQSAAEGVATVRVIGAALLSTKHRIRREFPKIYSQDLINNLFTHPYTKIEFIERDLDVSRVTATKYLETLVGGGILRKRRIGRSNYYINVTLDAILTREPGAEALG
jgi:Fic family protein